MKIDEVAKLVELSARVYSLAAHIETKDLFSTSARRTVFHQSQNDALFVMIEEEDNVTVCFRGSVREHEKRVTGKSWLNNFKTKLRPISVGTNSRVHSGYLAVATMALRRIKGRLAGKKLTFTGHSQGGALALALAIQTKRFYRAAEIKVVTFGQPRTANGPLCRFLDQHEFWPTDRYVNIWDGFTVVPPEAMGYRHCKRPIFLTDGFAMEGSPHFGFHPIKTSQMHPISIYQERIHQLLEQYQ